MLPPFKSATSHTKVCSHASAAPTQNTAGKAQWTNPVTVPNFNPHLLVCNDLQGIPPTQLLPPPLMMNGLGSQCHCPACSGTTGYRDGAKNAEQVRYSVPLFCQVITCNDVDGFCKLMSGFHLSIKNNSHLLWFSKQILHHFLIQSEVIMAHSHNFPLT